MIENPVEPRISYYLHTKGASLGLPVSGTFELTPRCNLSCKMCYVRLDETEMRSRGRELTADEWLTVAKDAADEGMLFLLLTGGEPMMRRDFTEILAGAKKLGLLVSVNSNGTMLSGDILRFFEKEPPFRVNVTLYGASEETYVRLCGKPMFGKVLENIRRLKALGVGVKINVSVTPYNKDDIKRIYEISEELEVPVQMATYMFPPIRRDEHMAGMNDRFTPCEAAACSIEWDKLRFDGEKFRLRAHAMSSGAGVGELKDGCVGENDDGTKYEGDGIMCRAGKSSFWINWMGEMTPCGMMNSPSVSVLDSGFSDAWRRTREESAKIRLPYECSVCPSKKVCGVCAAMCVCESGKYDIRPDYVCKMTAEQMRLYKKISEEIKFTKEEETDK